MRLYGVLEPLAYLFTLVFILTIPLEKILEFEGLGTISRLAGLPLICAWVLALIIRFNLRSFSAFHWFSLLYVVICGLSYFWSFTAEGTEILFKSYLQLYLVAVFMWVGLNTETRCVQAFFAYLIGSWIVVVLTYYNFSTGSVEEWSGRTTVGNADANQTALLLAMGLPIGWYLATRKRNPGVKNFLFKFVSFSYLPAAVVAMVMTGSRGGVLSALPLSLIHI